MTKHIDQYYEDKKVLLRMTDVEQTITVRGVDIPCFVDEVIVVESAKKGVKVEKETEDCKGDQ
jgi:hypothetical protein